MKNNKIYSLLILPPLARYADAALLLLRLMIGAFLMWGVMDNITSTEHMKEFVAFLANFGFPYPNTMAPLSVWAQFFLGVAFITGFLTRWAGIVCAINFVVAIVMVDAQGGIRAAFPSACLIMFGLYLATRGPGRFSVDHFLMNKWKM